MNFQKSVPEAFGFASFLEYNCQVVEKLDREKTGVASDSESNETDTVSSQITLEPVVGETPEPEGTAVSVE